MKDWNYWLFLALSSCNAFDERLDILPITNGLLLAHFQFTQIQIVPPSSRKTAHLIDYGTFPAAIQEVVHTYGLEEFRLSFGRGRWDHRIWGQAPFQLANTGIQLHAWFKSEGASVDGLWERFTHTLSGLLCGSIGLLNDAKTSVPLLTFKRTSSTVEPTELRFGVLPREAVCTENLTPWVKMLPCMSNVH